MRHKLKKILRNLLHFSPIRRVIWMGNVNMVMAKDLPIVFLITHWNSLVAVASLLFTLFTFIIVRRIIKFAGLRVIESYWIFFGNTFLPSRIICLKLQINSSLYLIKIPRKDTLFRITKVLGFWRTWFLSRIEKLGLYEY